MHVLSKTHMLPRLAPMIPRVNTPSRTYMLPRVNAAQPRGPLMAYMALREEHPHLHRPNS